MSPVHPSVYVSYHNVNVGQLNDVELENQGLKASLEDVNRRHKELSTHLEQTALGASEQQAALESQQQHVAELSEQLAVNQEKLSDVAAKLSEKQDAAVALADQNASLQQQLQTLQVRLSLPPSMKAPQDVFKHCQSTIEHFQLSRSFRDSKSC